MPTATSEQAALAVNDSAPPALAEVPSLRVIRAWGEGRRERRLPAPVDHAARRLAVGASPAPPLPLATATDGERSARGQVLTLTAPVSVRSAAGAGDASDPRDRLRLRALSLGVPFLHLPPTLPADCAGMLSVELARALRAVPVGRTATALTVALDTRWDARTLFRLRAATGLEIFPVLTQPDELERALAQLAR